MAAPITAPKRHRGNKLGERRGKGDAASSRDASEEDNDADNDVSDVASLASASAHTSTSTPASTASTTASSPRMAMGQGMQPPVLANPVAPAIPNAARRALARGRVDEVSGEGSQSEGLDSPTYDGDVESSSTIGGTPHNVAHHQSHHFRRPSSPTPEAGAGGPEGATSQRLPTPKASKANLQDESYEQEYRRPSDVIVQKSISLAEPTKSQTMPLSSRPSMAELGPPKMTQRPVELSEANIKGFVERAIHGRGEEDGVDRWWKTNAPPEGKVVRVYADGVYDLFHFGHGLQLRQAKLSFPKVQLLVGVCSDDLCASHKSAPSMTHAERCEAVRQCRWVDEVIPDAPWVVDQEFLDKHNIDYIAHDELVYPSKTHDDVYSFAKTQGRFVPTRRTPAISTSDLLERIVRGYRDGFFDSKLEKNGHPELLAADVDWDSSASVERRERRALKKKDKEGSHLR